MRFEILLPTQYVSNTGKLVDLNKMLLSSVEQSLVMSLLKFESGIMRSKTEGYYKHSNGKTYFSKYISIIVYSDNSVSTGIYNLIFNSNLIPSICNDLKQESIGVIVDNRFICINKWGTN